MSVLKKLLFSICLFFLFSLSPHASYEQVDLPGPFTNKDGIFYLDKFSISEDETKITIRGYLIVKGVDNGPENNIKFDLLLKNQNANITHTISLDRWTEPSEYPFVVPGENGRDYSAAWFKKELDLSAMDQGDYQAYIRSRVDNYETTALLNNVFGLKITNTFSTPLNKGFLFRVNHYSTYVPIELFIRNAGLISNRKVPTNDNMFNEYSSINFNGSLLNIKGVSYNVGGNYSKSMDVERKIVLENTETFERRTYTSNYIDNGDYQVILRVPDGQDKTRAWFNSNIDVRDLPFGTYTIYVATKSGEVEDYGELVDIFYRNLSTKKINLGNKIAYLKLNQDKRSRIELVIQEPSIYNQMTALLWRDNGIYLEGYAYDRINNDTIDHKLVLENTDGASPDILFNLNGISPCSVTSLTNCSIYLPGSTYNMHVNLTSVPNGTYKVKIKTNETTENIFSLIGEGTRIVRAKVGGKLITFDYTSGIQMIVEDHYYDYDILIDPGHEPGLDTGTSYRGMPERDLNMEVSLYEKARYESMGLRVLITRTDYTAAPLRLGNPEWESLARRAYAMGYYGAVTQVVYSNHHNGGVSSATGFEIILPATFTISKFAPELAIYNAWSSLIAPSALAGGFYTRDYDDAWGFVTKKNGEVYDFRTYYAVIRTPERLFNVKSVLYEPIYMTNTSNMNWYYTNKNWKKMSEAKIKAYVESIGKTYIAP